MWGREKGSVCERGIRRGRGKVGYNIGGCIVYWQGRDVSRRTRKTWIDGLMERERA